MKVLLFQSIRLIPSAVGLINGVVDVVLRTYTVSEYNNRRDW